MPHDPAPQHGPLREGPGKDTGPSVPLGRTSEGACGGAGRTAANHWTGRRGRRRRTARSGGEDGVGRRFAGRCGGRIAAADRGALTVMCGTCGCQSGASSEHAHHHDGHTHQPAAHGDLPVEVMRNILADNDDLAAKTPPPPWYAGRHRHQPHVVPRVRQDTAAGGDRGSAGRGVHGGDRRRLGKPKTTRSVCEPAASRPIRSPPAWHAI